MKKLILHIPHSSSVIPDYEGYVVSKEVLDQEILKLTDWHTEDLFECYDADRVVVPFSRIFCDVERFDKDGDEPMSQFGMGVLYQKTDNGLVSRVVDDTLRGKILNAYYRPHHEALSALVDDHLRRWKSCLIVDCHSFPDTPINASLNKEANRPDFNIGTDPYHTPGRLVEISRQYFEDQNHSLWIDKPYTGSMVPMKHYKQDSRVQSIMLEVNRKLYLKENSNDKSENYAHVKNLVIGWLEAIRRG